MIEPQIDDELIEIDKVLPILKISKTMAWRLANGEWMRAGVSLKVGGRWRISWPKFLAYYHLEEKRHA